VTAPCTATVRAAVMRAPETLGVDAFPFPELEDCAVLMRVSSSGVCPPATEMPWNFAVVGRGHGLPWWQALLTDRSAAGRVETIAIEPEGPFAAPEIGCQQAVRLLTEVLGNAAMTRMDA